MKKIDVWRGRGLIRQRRNLARLEGRRNIICLAMRGTATATDPEMVVTVICLEG